MITHNEITAGWCLLVAAVSVPSGLLAAHWWWPSRKRLQVEYLNGRLGGWDAAMDRVRIEDDASRPNYEAGETHLTAIGRALGHTVIDGDPVTQGRTIYPELAALADPPDGPESHGDGRTPLAVGLDPHWYARQLHGLADWQAEWHADADKFADWLPGYLDWYRRGLEPSWSAASRILEAL